MQSETSAQRLTEVAYSQAALAARPAFFAPLNDITIIVEDECKERFYTQVFKSLLPENVKFSKVLGMGGKDNVLQRFVEGRHDDPLPREFYVVDGDFDDLLGRAIPASDYLYRLTQYDIENFLVEEEAICTIAEEDAPRRSVIEYRDLLQISSWMSDVVEASVRFTACAALLQLLDERSAAVARSISRFAPGHDCIPDGAMIESHIAKIREDQSAVDDQEFDRQLQQMIERMGDSQAEQIRWVSGKRILIPLVIKLVRQHARNNISAESLCFRLAKFCEFQGLADLRDRILAVA